MQTNAQYGQASGTFPISHALKRHPPTHPLGISLCIAYCCEPVPCSRSELASMIARCDPWFARGNWVVGAIDLSQDPSSKMGIDHGCLKSNLTRPCVIEWAQLCLACPWPFARWCGSSTSSCACFPHIPINFLAHLASAWHTARGLDNSYSRVDCSNPKAPSL